MTQANTAMPTPTQAIAGGIDRLVFASIALQSIPTDYYAKKLGFDPTQWAQEAMDIRDAYESDMRKAGVNIQLPFTLSKGGSVGPYVRQFYDLLQKKHPERFASLPEGAGGDAKPGDPSTAARTSEELIALGFRK